MITDELYKNANAIVRFQENIVEVKTLNNVIFKRKEAITILNSSGIEYANIYLYYTHASPIKNIKVSVYDAHGKIIKKVNANEFKDVSAISDISLFEDSRVKYYKPSITEFPYIIEYEYEERRNHTFYFPRWIPQKGLDIAVEKSKFTFISKPDYSIRLKEHSVNTLRKEYQQDGNKITEWELHKLPAFKAEPFTPPLSQVVPWVEVAPVKFTYEGLSGSFSNWQEYGKWAFENLLKDRDQLPPTTNEEIKNLVKGILSPVERVRKIYEYAQQKNRYISVQIGIGGLQPMKAEEVNKLGYGDCKALTNYTKALLKAANIPSYYTEVHAGFYKTNYQSDFASAFQGNHAILCVPIAKDTIWLECTSRDAPMGYLGTFTDDRKALLYTENGGIIVRTKTYQPEENKQLKSINLVIDEKGNLNGNIHTRFEGIQYERRKFIVNRHEKEHKELIEKFYNINNLNVVTYKVYQQKTDTPFTEEKIEVKAESYGTINSSLLFIPIYQLVENSSNPKDILKCRQKIRIERGFYDEDIITFNIPESFKVEYLPQSINITTPFGTFSSTVKAEGNSITFTRKVLFKQGEYSPDLDNTFYSFLKKIDNSNKERFVLIMK
ncbi:DUF3857 domain-containing protein [Adhaeribacter aquaticus]|uniref:DUF3857 domain-containing protein n=1 Tax=Adhaeribacter aquaticus TaxID=299567 RepID=UPI00068547F9|nr:DUF3857 domain-containing protein [Adhaeribacter aquaticus]